MRDGLIALGLEDVEVQANSRWRRFIIVVDGVTLLDRKGWGGHVPSVEDAYEVITDEDLNGPT